MPILIEGGLSRNQAFVASKNGGSISENSPSVTNPSMYTFRAGGHGPAVSNQFGRPGC